MLSFDFFIVGSNDKNRKAYISFNNKTILEVITKRKGNKKEAKIKRRV